MNKLTIKEFRPSPVRIFCRVIEPEKKDGLKKTASGIFIKEESEGVSREPKTLAEIISVGEKIEMKLSPGDMVYYYPHGGQLFNLEDQECIILTEGEILGVWG